jgi:hypothetical protein
VGFGRLNPPLDWKKAKDNGKENLRLRCNIAWWGERGLHWTGFWRSIEAQVLLSTPPSIIIINLDMQGSLKWPP